MHDTSRRFKHEILLKLHSVSSGLNGESFDPKRLFDYIVTSAMELTKATRGILVGVGKNAGDLIAHSAVNVGTKTPQQALEHLSRGIVQDCVSTGQAIIVQNAALDPEHGKRESVTRLKLMSVAVVPLIVDARVVGALYVDNARAVNQFGPNEQMLLEIFANQAALALRRIEEQRK